MGIRSLLSSTELMVNGASLPDCPLHVLLISAPSYIARSYYCQQLTLSVTQNFKLILLFCFSMESSHFLDISSP